MSISELRPVVPVLAIGLLAGVLQAAPPEIPAGHVLPADYLAGLAAPSYAPGHTLPPLTRFGWTLDLDTRIELARRWGYALEWGGYATEKAVSRALADPKNPSAVCMKLAADDPETFKLAVICSRELPESDAVPPETWSRDEKGNLLSAQARSLDGTAWVEGVDALYSPLAPDSVWLEAGRLRAEPLKRIREKCRIAIVLNGGEYGLGVPGFARKAWEQDPSIMAAKGPRSWYEFASEAKARAELLIADAVRDAVPDRQAYIYYVCSGGTLRNVTPTWQDWSVGFEWLNPVSDLPSSEHYYRGFNTGWTGSQDMLSQALNARGFEIAAGKPLCYDWLSAGWEGGGLGAGTEDRERDHGFGALDRYRGFLKCLYTAGMIGGNAGYYSFPKGEVGGKKGFMQPFPPDDPPHWLLQMIALSEVHALFSHLEPYLREGDLLPGPNPHRWSNENPAYEFPTGHADTRVLARRLKKDARWLITAWAADGVARDVSVEIPKLGKVGLEARPAGTVCTATLVDGRPQVTAVELIQTKIIQTKRTSKAASP